MSFIDIYTNFKNFNFDKYFSKIKDSGIIRIINKESITPIEFLSLLSPQSEKFLEPMAQKANKLTTRHFGKTILLYAPMYLSNYCVNKCIYCSFNASNNITRKKLSISEVEQEARTIASYGIRHVLILTGSSRNNTPVAYIEDCVKVLKKYFTSISIEVYPLETKEYRKLVKAGVEGLCIYQEVYNEDTYRKVHLKGPKTNYKYRLDAPERGCIAKMRNVNIGILLGLEDFRTEAFFTGLHAYYLQNNYPDVEISVSLPRVMPHIGSFNPKNTVTDKNFVQIMLALRLFMPRLGITISTRERPDFRNNLIGLGVTKMSAASKTEVGGYSLTKKTEKQFNISDERSVEAIKNMIYKKGYQPVFI